MFRRGKRKALIIGLELEQSTGRTGRSHTSHKSNLIICVTFFCFELSLETSDSRVKKLLVCPHIPLYLASSINRTLMANSTSFLGCNHSYDVFTENLKFFLQLLYLVPALFLLIRMIYVITISHWDDYAKQPFWTLYLIDCVVVSQEVIRI